LIHGPERPFRTAVGVRLVDPTGEGALTAAARNLDDQVAREGEHRDRLHRRIGAHEHHRVRARPERLLAPGALVVADHDGDGRLVRLRNVEDRLGLPDLLGVRPDRFDALVDEEPRTPGEGAGGHEQGDKEPEDDAADDAKRASPPTAVTRHRSQRRQRDAPMAVFGYPARASLERGPHTKNRPEATQAG
jgi:hypothetical protein